MDSTATNTTRPVVYDFAKAQQAWSRLPCDELGYLSTDHLLRRSAEQLRDMIATMKQMRYDQQGWRNWNNQWREFFGMDTTTGKRILDFGCGVGLDALQFAESGNDVMLADINWESVQIATRVLQAHNCEPADMIQVYDDTPFFTTIGEVDVFYSAGVLHHTPEMRRILDRECQVLSADGEMMVLVYSDRRWSAMGIPLPPIDQEISTHSAFTRFVRSCDEVGHFADWYN